MGCDIHLHIEIKIADKWYHYGNPCVDRRYSLFEKMAGVRGKIENALACPKGLPDDASLITLLHYFDRLPICEAKPRDNWHTPSWLARSTGEIEALNKWLESHNEHWRDEWDLEHHILHSYLFNNSFRSTSVKEIQDVRFVFWFDN